MRNNPLIDYVVALDTAGTAHVCVAARDAATALEIAYDVVRQPDIDDLWPRRQTADFIGPRAAPARNTARSFEVSLPIVGTAYVTVSAPDPAAAIATAFTRVSIRDLNDWRTPVPLHPPSVALEANTRE